jgi:hypothetical protein
MSFITDFLSKYVWMALAAVIVALAVYCGVLTVERNSATEKLVQLQAADAISRAQADDLALATDESYRLKDKANYASNKKASDDLQVSATRNAKLLADARSDLVGVRASLDAYASGSGSAPGVPAASPSDRASALGSVLGSVLQDTAQCANDAEGNADTVRALLTAWPH